MVGLPLGTVYSKRAMRRAPDRGKARVAFVLSMIALLGLAALILLNVLA